MFDSPLKPIYLLADSQLLFWREDGGLFHDTMRKLLGDSPRSVYLGASNGDRPEFYGIFQAAMEGLGVHERHIVSSTVSEDDLSWIETADLILLAGGDVLRGWRIFEQNGLKELLVKKYYEGVVLVGVSAGAVQLGLLGWPEGDVSPERAVEMFNLIPFIIGAHDEHRGWAELKRSVEFMGGSFKGLGIPAGGGAIYHADQTIQPIRRPLHEFSIRDGELTHGLLIP